MYGIITRDPAIVAAEFEQVIRKGRRFQFLGYEMVICLIAHALAELAYWVSPDLMPDFDINRPLPWDREYYKYLCRPNRSQKYLDLSRHSSLLHRWIHDLEEPGWWAKCKY